MEKKLLPLSGKGHGSLERGLDETPRSRLAQGRFGRLFRALPPAGFSDDMLMALAGGNKHLPEGMITNAEEVTSENLVDSEENLGLPAGYTYFGQFVDHDITFDPLSSLVKANDPDGLTNFRTPALDLDSLYGRGPDDQPYMYEKDGLKFALSHRKLKGIRLGTGNTVEDLQEDLPRFNGRALIGDKRNDENVIVSQLHGLFLRFHNKLVDTFPTLTFSTVQRLVRWHYQWLVLFDYLPRIVGQKMVEKILPHLVGESNIYEKQPQLYFYNYRNYPFIPVEFSGAAYRFGHSMVRPVYRLSAFNFADTRPQQIEGLDGRKILFDPFFPELDLRGFGEYVENNGIDWQLFFDTAGRKLDAHSVGKDRIQPAYKIDTSLVNPLRFLPEHSKDGTDQPKEGLNLNNLAFRNLKRGVALQLPSGQDVARYMGIEPIKDERLLVGQATLENLKADINNKSGIKLKSIIDMDKGFAGKSPLWLYMLAEAGEGWQWKVREKKENGEDKSLDEKNAIPTVLGPVGGRIVAEVLIGLVLGDNDSFLAMDPNWKPLFSNQKATSVFDRFTMGDLVELLSR